MIDHLLFNAHKFYPINDNADSITAGSQKFVKSYIGRKATAGAPVSCSQTESGGMEYWFQDGRVNVGDTITNQVIDKNNENWLSVDNKQFLGAHPRPFFKLSKFLSNGGKLS